LKKVYYYCTCNKQAKGNGAEGFREVLVDNEGICLDCGYYAMVLPRTARNRMEMYSILRIDKQSEENHYLGESLVETIRGKQENLEYKGIKPNSKNL
jgi:hypothetical protein